MLRRLPPAVRRAVLGETRRSLCVAAAATAASAKPAAPEPEAASAFSFGNFVCGAALVGTVGGAVKFLIDFPEPCQARPPRPRVAA